MGEIPLAAGDRRSRGGTARRAAALERIATVRTEARIPRLIELLDAAGVAAIALKGPVTRRRLYTDGEDRPTADVDLIVAPNRFRAARRTLVADGYERVMGGGHSDTLHGPDGDVDLHIALPLTTVPPSAAFRVLRAHTTTMSVAGRPIPVLDVPAHVVHLAVHAAQNGFDPRHRSLEEWRRGRAGLSPRDAAVAEAVATRLGARDAWQLATIVLAHPEERAELVARLPVRKLEPSLSAAWALARSPIPARVRARAVRSFVDHQLSDVVLDPWRAQRGLDPVVHGTAAARRAKLVRLATVASAPMTRRTR